MNTNTVHHSRELRTLLRAQLSGIVDGQLDHATIESLLTTCGDSTLLAALDLIDSNEGRENVEMALSGLHSAT